MSEHEMFPDDAERLSRLEVFQQRINSILNTNPMRTGLLDKVNIIDEKLNKLEALIKTVRMAVIFMSVGGLIAAVIFGIIKLKDAISLIK
jgi:hypothetical protein